MGSIKELLLKNEDMREQLKVYKEYLSYVRNWYAQHSDLKYEGMEPLSFEAFRNAKSEEL